MQGCWLVHDAGADADTVAVVSSAHRLAIPENSSKIIHAIAWHRSPSSSSYRSELGASSNSLSWTEKSETNKRHISDDYGGMKSGSHSQTLGRLYAWEKKLYEEVKLRNQDAKGAQLHCAEKTRTNDGELSVKNKTQVSLVFFHVLRPQLSNDQFSAVLLTALFTFFLN
ncbi:uncharacterized protein LOC119295568 isoform X2 [Triticum dicoccoides]|uniref:uncharacterized protein LOC119295568 isoform X2 n=1 Tax=Triticum dicoccoides TaxID=85692 RepID=UPI0018902941|nr:uncharacterized protein LOC119295568 isoform X2 [Triticum dicoccoides]